jgi:Tol biopolymer transport system component
MKTIVLTFLLFVSVMSSRISAQTIETIAKVLPSHFSVLTNWGLRPDWDETGENLYFLNKIVGDVFKINIKTREVTCVTDGFYHGGIFRAQCLANGDLLLAIGGDNFDAKSPERDRHTGLQLYILKKDHLSKPYPLGEVCEEGPALSKKSMKIAWTLVGQREICVADVVYNNGIPKLVNKKSVINYKDSTAYVRLETQDFRPPYDKELIYTHYWGDAKDSYHHSETYGFDLETSKFTNYTHLGNSYNECEGIFPDGKYVLIESDRHQPKELRNQYKLDVYKLKLDGSGEVERLADFSTRFPGVLRSDNPVVSPTGKLIAVQFGFQEGAGNGRGIFLFDVDKYEKGKNSK